MIIIGIVVIILVISELNKKNKVDREKKYITNLNSSDSITYYIRNNAPDKYNFYFQENDLLEQEADKIKEYINERYVKGKELKDEYKKTEDIYIMANVYSYIHNYIDNDDFKYNNDYISEKIVNDGIEKTPIRKKDGYLDNGIEKYKLIEKDYPYTEYIYVLTERGKVLYKMLYSAYGYLTNRKKIINNEAYKEEIRNIIDNECIKIKRNEYMYKIID